MTQPQLSALPNGLRVVTRAMPGLHLGGGAARGIVQPQPALEHEEILVLVRRKDDAPVPRLAGPDAGAQVALRRLEGGPGLAARAA